MCMLGPKFNSRMVHFFSSTNNIIIAVCNNVGTLFDHGA
jgi:hypothetical protein